MIRTSQRPQSTSVRRTSSSVARRAGLAPVELVMALPILIMVLAVVVLMGQAACWKLRTEGVARYAGERELPPRIGDGLRPPQWQVTSAQMSTTKGLPFFADDPFATHTAVRGPVLKLINGDSYPVDPSVFLTQPTTLSGLSALDHPPIAMPKLKFRNKMDAQLDWLYGTARFSEVNLNDNRAHRTTPLYGITILPL